MKAILRPAGIAALLCICTGTAYAAPEAPSDTPSTAVPQAFALYAQDAPLAVRPLDDPANPYLGRYSEIDRWIYAHAWSHADLEAFRTSGHDWAQAHPGATDDDPPLRFMACRVDPDGWVKPVELSGTTLEWERQRGFVLFDREKDQQARNQPEVFDQRNLFAGTGVSDELYQEYKMLQLKHDAALTPRILDWLGSAPAQYTVFVPNGEIVTFGAPGEKLQTPAEQPSMGDGSAGNPYIFGGSPQRTDPRGLTYFPDFNRELDWQRYSADGTLLGEAADIPSGSGPYWGWTSFYWPQREQAVKGADGSFRLRDGKFGLYSLRIEPMPAEQEVLRFNPETKQMEKVTQRPYDAARPVAAFAYDGTPLDLYQPLPAELKANRTATQSRLADLYAAQQYYGVWWGKE